MKINIYNGMKIIIVVVNLITLNNFDYILILTTKLLIMNVQGQNQQIEYYDDSWRQCIGKSDAEVQGGITTRDPQWSVSYDKGGSWTGPYEAISIIADDKSIWRNSMHASMGLGGHEIWFENLHGSDTWWSRGNIDILDWNKQKWKMQIGLVANQYSSGSKVVFNLTKY